MFLNCLTTILIILTFGTPEISSQVSEQQQLLLCISYEVCGQCLSAPSSCRWCADPYFSSTQPRCNLYQRLVEANCSQTLIQDSEREIYEEIENRPLQSVSLDNLETIVQIEPQRIRLSLKPRQTKKIKFKYRPARNYPLDLYYLMDLTWSMKDDKQTLVSLRDDLPVMLKNLTDNFRLGFGTFADKPVMPYISMDTRRQANPCAGQDEACEPTYSFRHRLSLTNQVNKFVENVNGSIITANLDNAEAQLDALMQVLTCEDRIGWLNESRKIVIILTDGVLHTAGDGVLGGTVQRNDEKCHLDDQGYYVDAAKYDYPSIAQIYRLLEFYKVNVIFAIPEDLKDYYDNMQKVLDKFTYVAKLESDSSNILKLVKKGYEDIMRVVNFNDNAGSGPIKLKYFTDCGVEGARLIETTTCKGVEFGMTLNFEVHITLNACPEYVKLQRNIRISETQLGQDFLTLDVDLQCGCTCDHSDAMNRFMAACPKNSHLVCGVCQCDKGWSGPNCDCSVGDEEASAALIGQCRNSKLNVTLICSGRGDCDCGSCNCDPGYNEKYCQCSTCPISSKNGVECGGSERGKCLCGSCECNSQWTGESCDCPEDTSTCTAPGSNEICSGHGKCACGICQCSNDKVKHTGEYCEMCTNCANSMCLQTEVIVNCNLDRNCTDFELLHTNQTFKFFNQLNENNEEENFTEPYCILRRIENETTCEYQYTYSVDKNNEVTIVLHAHRCSVTTAAMFLNYGPIIVIITIVIGAIVIVFIKMCQVYADRRAYEKFQREVDKSKIFGQQQQNPLYKSPISEFTLPEAYHRDKLQ